MYKTSINSKAFIKDMNNIINYSVGFLDGVQRGKKLFLDNLGKDTIELMKEFVDSSARTDPALLHHVYEWNQVGSPSSRLFNINYTVSGLGLSFGSTFSQSKSVKAGSKTPFYDKARIMENGTPVVITPTRSSVLVFDDNGEEVFTKGPVEILNPGGDFVEGGFEKTIDQFLKYFSQAFMRSSGVSSYIENPEVYKKNLPKGRRMGKTYGVSTGIRWIANAGVIR